MLSLREYYDASIGVSGERQKLLRLLQNENESIVSWEMRVPNQANEGPICRRFNVWYTETRHKQKLGYEKLSKFPKRSKRLCSRSSSWKLPGTHIRNKGILRENQHLQICWKIWIRYSNCRSVSGLAATINSPVNSTTQHLAKDVVSVGSLVIWWASVEIEQDDKDDSSNRITFCRWRQWWRRSG